MYKVFGTIPGRNALDPLETTPLSTLHVTGADKRELYFRSRHDMTWRRVDLTRLNFSPSATSKSAKVTNAAFSFVDVTSELL